MDRPVFSKKRASEIMGKNFFGIDEAIKHFSVNPSSKQIVALSRIPFSEAVLEQSRDTHILIAVFPLSIPEIRENNPKLFYESEWFAKEPIEVNWQLVRKTPVDNSLYKEWFQQKSLISEDDEVPTAQVMVYTIIGHFLATGERLFKRVYVRTSIVGSGGYHIYIGYFDTKGLCVNYCCDNLQDDYLGISFQKRGKNEKQ